MGLPVSLQLYPTTRSFATTGISSSHGQLSEIAPNPFSASAQGWNVGANSIPRVVQMDFGIEVSRTATNPAWNTTITGSGPNNRIGDSWVYGPLNGDFDGTEWQITQSYKAVTLAGPHLGRLFIRVYKAPSPSLSGSDYPPYMLSASYFSGSTATTGSFAITNISPSFAAVATINRLTGSFGLGPQQFRNEYLMLQTFFNLTTVGSGNNSDLDLVFGPTASVFKTANFNSYGMDAVRWNSDDFG
jgi:hypothetical protein